MNSSVISGLIGGLVSVVLCSFLVTKIRGAALDGMLRFGWGLAVLGWSCLAFVGFAIWALFYDLDVWEKRSEFYSVIGLIVGFGAGAIYSFAEYFYTYGTYDKDGIEFRTPWTGVKKERWRDLESVEFNPTANWYVLRFESGNMIRLSSLLGGHGGVLELLGSDEFDL